jgi:hypothetical protein
MTIAVSLHSVPSALVLAPKRRTKRVPSEARCPMVSLHRITLRKGIVTLDPRQRYQLPCQTGNDVAENGRPRMFEIAGCSKKGDLSAHGDLPQVFDSLCR